MYHQLGVDLESNCLYLQRKGWIFLFICFFMSRHEVHSMNTHTLKIQKATLCTVALWSHPYAGGTNSCFLNQSMLVVHSYARGTTLYAGGTTLRCGTNQCCFIINQLPTLEVQTVALHINSLRWRYKQLLS